ncbi:[protein release factor]-glutamine N5-methyltransferase [Thiogranum longum]|uniref:Release factor glutamine methyltransferase n=1 Tax=Thiogranum longum TaxID=1537524 RepID=A0A4R1HER7_9GAMM|nr:peptide chain release factor N(5)-glutamine methyltransferase [Thiogranum longum]TCK19221.1 [protein release factor]-glutamine N5-methyltransferase [Thiogranum longum]
MTSIAQALQQARAQLQTSDTAQLDAEVLMMHVLGKPRSYLHAWPEAQLDTKQLEQFTALVEARSAGQPVAYLTGQREFWSLQLEVSEHTLIPRPDTELLVEQTLALLPADEPLQVLDAGTGSGAIALALAHERPHWQVFASDRSPECLVVACHNAARLGLGNIHFFTGHWCDAVAGQRLDALVSNPPYIAEQDPHLGEGDVRFEPRSALSAGSEGLDDLTQLAAAATRVLKPGGHILLEHGFEQAEAVRILLKDNELSEISSIRDLAGHERVSHARKTA